MPALSDGDSWPQMAVASSVTELAISWWQGQRLDDCATQEPPAETFYMSLARTEGLALIVMVHHCQLATNCHQNLSRFISADANNGTPNDLIRCLHQ